jgi:hypothetical protein
MKFIALVSARSLYGVQASSRHYQYRGALIALHASYGEKQHSGFRKFTAPLVSEQFSNLFLAPLPTAVCSK